MTANKKSLLKTAYIAFSALVCVGLPSAYIYGDSTDSDATITASCNIRFSNGYAIDSVPLAETKAQQSKGLSNLDDVGNGMIFRWVKADVQFFWMKETNQDLSIGFFDETGKLFLIKNMLSETLDIHSSIKPAIYALELKAGTYQTNSITIGTRIESLTCIDSKKAVDKTASSY